MLMLCLSKGFEDGNYYQIVYKVFTNVFECIMEICLRS